MGRLHAMRWSSVTLSAILSKVESRGLPNPSLPPSIVRISYHSSYHSGGVGCQAGKVARQARLQGRRRRQAGKASQAVMCWGYGVPGRQSRLAGVASQAVMCWGAGCQAGEAARQARSSGRRGQSGRHVLGGAGYQAGKVARQARPPGRQGHHAGKAAKQARSPGRRGQSGHHVLGGVGYQPGKVAR